MNLSDRHPYLPLILVCAWLFLCLAVGVSAPLVMASVVQP